MLVLVYSFISIALAFAYVFLMWRYYQHWNTLAIWKIPSDFQAKTSISILAPARNEAEHIEASLRTMLQQDYPSDLYEIIIIDDHSTDNTASLVRAFAQKHPNIKLLQLADYIDEKKSSSFKKRAIEVALEVAKGELIVTTDADCIVPPKWLSYFSSYYDATQVKFIAAPVNFHQEKNSLERFQSLDFIGMMGITGAGIQGDFMHMCNGANLAYPKHAFKTVNGFEGIDQVASGDDMLLMQKIAAHFPNQIGYIKNLHCTVYTDAKPTWKAFIQQRIRWASKSRNHTDWGVVLQLSIVFFFCCTIVLNALLLPFIGIALFLFQLLTKALADFFFLRHISTFFQRKELMRSFAPSFFLHVAYIVVVGTLGNLIKEYTWKGRRTK